MNPETLRKIFKSPFDYKTYSNEIVHRLFGNNDVATTPELLDTNATGDKSYFIGQMEDADGRLLGFFYTRVADGGDVRRKRVGLRKLIQPYLKYDVDGAIAVFDDGNHWRLSYICDLKEGSTSAKRFSYILGDEQGQYKTPIERLGKVAEKNGRFKLSDLREAFSVDALSKEFFDEYHRHYDIIINELKGQGFEGATIHDYVKKMMGRIVFLHFLQKKGWLNGNLAFLRDLFFFSPHQGDFLEQVLEPLFFGIFNTEKANREQLFKAKGWDMGLLVDWKELPYLNGGLFERDAVDEQNITLPASLFEDLFTFMASYNFTVDENDPDDAEVGVDPEMLGKIFESLLEDNKAKGAFYTPKEIVRYMCKESLIAYLATQIDKSQSERKEKSDSSDGSDCDKYIRAFVETHEMQPELEPYRDTLDQALRNVKICDPAIGSGAFPMGLLNELWRCREALAQSNSQSELKEQKENHNNIIGKINSDNSFSSDCKKETSDCMMSRVELKKEIIENNIYGVDIEKGAIDIARLRFWLSIVVDADKPDPLPNFDYKFMQGNSLIESFEGFDLSRISSRLRGGQSKSMQLVLGLDSHTSRQNLQRLLREYFSVTDHKKKASMRQAINEEVKTLIRESIGGTPASLAKLEKMDCSANQDFFLWHTWFKDIFDNGGFDIVIGNPPYVSAPTQMANEILATQRERIVSSKRYKSLYQKWDLYIPFIELGIMLNVSSGVTTMIVPFPLTSQLYAKVLRKMLVENNDMYELVDLNGTKIFENATVSNCIPFIKKTKTQGFTWISSIDENTSIKRDFKQLHIELVQDEKNYVWNVTKKRRETKRHVNMHILGDFCYISPGMVLNADEKSAKGQFKKDDLISATQDEIHCKKYIEGKDLERYFITRNRFLEYNTIRVPDKVRRPTFRELYTCPKLVVNSFSYFKIALDNQGELYFNDKVRTAVRWCDIANVKNKSIDAVVKKSSSLSRVEMEEISKHVDSRFLLGILNSCYARTLLDNIRGGDFNIYPEYIRNIPIPNATKEQQQSIIMLVDVIITKKKNNPQSDTSAIEQQIDQLVYQLYNLTPEEIAVIEKNTQ